MRAQAMQLYFLHRDQCNHRKHRLHALSMRQRGGEVRADFHRANKCTLFAFDGESKKTNLFVIKIWIPFELSAFFLCVSRIS